MTEWLLHVKFLICSRMWYNWLFGGALMFTRQQYEKVNGFSNAYFGWGGEDDDLSDRSVNRLIENPISDLDL